MIEAVRLLNQFEDEKKRKIDIIKHDVIIKVRDTKGTLAIDNLHYSIYN